MKCHKCGRATKRARVCYRCRDIPSGRGYAHKGHGLVYRGEPVTATDVEPGTDKVDVLMERARLGLGLFHRGDRRADLR